MPDLPAPFPKLPDDQRKLLAWASKATKHEITSTYRPGRHEHAGLVIRVEGGHELFFETTAEACRVERFTTAFISIDGKTMPEWSKAQVKAVVGALIRAAQVGVERDERETFTDLGSRYLVGCIAAGTVIEHGMKEPGDEYAGALRLKQATRFLRGDDGERWPEILHAPDLEAFFLVRGLFLAYSKRLVGRMNTATLNEQMRRVGWQDVELNRRPPGNPDGPRPHLRAWRIPDGWDNIWAADAAEYAAGNHGPAVPHGPGATRTGAPGRASSAKSTRDRGTVDRGRWRRP